jgi:hypothetical protein
MSPVLLAEKKANPVITATIANPAKVNPGTAHELLNADRTLSSHEAPCSPPAAKGIANTGGTSGSNSAFFQS